VPYHAKQSTLKLRETSLNPLEFPSVLQSTPKAKKLSISVSKLKKIEMSPLPLGFGGKSDGV
jgi:hypothetical protein